jgi:hypothetical protein
LRHLLHAAAESSAVPRKNILERILKRAVELVPQLAAREVADMLEDLAAWKVKAGSCSCAAALISALKKRFSLEGGGDAAMRHLRPLGEE